MTLLQQSWKFNFEKKNFVATMEKIVATKIWGQRSLLQQCAHRVAIMKIDLQPSGHERWSNVQFSNKISTQQCFPLRGKHCCVEFCCWIQTILQPNFKIFQILSQIWLQYWKILQQKVAKNLTFGCNIENTATEGCNRRSRSLRYCFILQPAMLQYSGSAATKNTVK